MKKLILGIVTMLSCLAGHAQKISFEKQTIVMPATMWKKPATAVFKFTNKDKNPLEVKYVDGGCGCMTAKWTTGELQKGEEGEICVTYDAKMLGKYEKVIEVYTNAGEKPVRITMKGWVNNGDKKTVKDLYPYEIGEILLSSNEVVFPEVNAGDSVTVELGIMNNGKEVYTPQLMHLPSYITASCEPEMIARGRHGRILLTLHSDKLPDLGLNQTNIYLARFFGDKVGDGNDIAVSAILLPDLKEAEAAASNPKFDISATELNMGKLGKKTKVTGKVKLSNKGNEVLKLNKIQAFNQAVTVALGKTELQPGESVDMKLTVDSRFLGMSKAKPRVLIVSNDPKKPMVVVNVNFEK